jgi:hypothetical protein
LRGSCGDPTVTEEQISIVNRDQDPVKILGETERLLFFESEDRHTQTAGQT